MTAIHSHERVSGPGFTRRAWWSLLGFVPSFVLAFLVGEGILSALGYSTDGYPQAPWWAVLTAAIPALVVFVLPAGFAAYFGRRAIRLGDDRGRTPVIVASVLVGAFLLQNGVSALAVWLA